jgi:hypothetical protein
VSTLLELRETVARFMILVDHVVNLKSLKSYFSFETISNSCIDSLMIIKFDFEFAIYLNRVNLK